MIQCCRMRLMVGLLLLPAVLLAACAGGRAPEERLPTVGQQLRLAQSYLNAGRIADALLAVDEALAIDPGRPPLYHFRGLIYFEAGDMEKAEQAFLDALEADSYYTDSHNFLGAVYSEMGRPIDAEREYQVALADPTYPTPELVHLNLALLYAEQGRNEEALRNFRKSVEISPRYYKGHFELASFLDGEGKLDEAATEYLVALPGYQSSGDYHYRLGLTYFRLGDKQNARASLNKVLDISPGSENAAQATELLRLLD